MVKAAWWPLYVGNDLAVNGNDGNDDSGVQMTVRNEAKTPSVSAISHDDVPEVAPQSLIESKRDQDTKPRHLNS